MASMLNALMQQHSEARNPLISTPATPSFLNSLAAQMEAKTVGPDRPPQEGGWTQVGQGERYDGEEGQPYNASYVILPSDQAPAIGDGHALFRFNMHRDELMDMGESANNGSVADHIAGHVGSKAMEKEHRHHDEAKTQAALEAVSRKMERMLKRRELQLEKKRYDDDDDRLPSSHSVFVRVERGKDAPYHKTSKADHDKAERAYADHRKHVDDARAAYATDANGDSVFRTGYMASFMTPEQMALPTPRERAIHVDTHQRRTGDNFDKWAERADPERFKAHKQAEALADIREAIGEAHGWHKVPL